MIDLIFEFLGDAVDWVGDLFTELPVEDIVEGAILIGGVAVVAELTYDVFKDQLHKNQELKNKGAIYVIIKEINDKGDYTEVDYSAYNAMNQQVGKYKSGGKKHSGLYVGQRISCS